MYIERINKINAKGEIIGERFQFRTNSWKENFRTDIGFSYLQDGLPIPQGFNSVGEFHDIPGMGERGLTFWVFYLFPFAWFGDRLRTLWFENARWAYQKGLIYFEENQKLHWFWPRYLKVFKRKTNNNYQEKDVTNINTGKNDGTEEH